MPSRCSKPLPTTVRLLLACAAVVGALAACGGGGGGAGAGDPVTGSPGDGGAGGGDTGGGGSTPPGPVATKLFLDPSWRTSHAGIAVDTQGGRHAAYAYYEPSIEQRPTGAVYQYCGGGCEVPTAWHGIQLGALVRSVQLKLTRAGHPRLLIGADSEVYTGGQDYFYAACDDACTQPSGWTVTRIFSGRVPASNLDNDDELPQRSFQLDPQDRPRFVVFDENQLATPEHAGLYYLQCDEHCDQPTQWRETLLTLATRYEVERVAQPALAFSPDGRPRIASAQFFPVGSRPPVLMVLGCDDACDHTESWGRAELMPRGGGAEPSVDIAVDADGRTHVAFYQEALLEGQGKRLFYLRCDDGCDDAGRWHTVDLGLGAYNGQEPDLELDAQGRPRIAYVDWDHGGIGYAWCDQACDTSASRWQHRLVDDRHAMVQSWPVAYPPHCTGGLWNSLTPTLALPANGAPQIAFDATYHARCLYDHNPYDNIPPGAEMNLITRAVRVVSVP